MSELRFTWRLSEKASGTVALAAAPGGTGMLEIPIPPGTREASQLRIRVVDRHDELVTAGVIQLGKPASATLPRPAAGPLWVEDDGPRWF